MLTSSLRWARAMPRFQFGSHCDVIDARAASTTPIKAVATKRFDEREAENCGVSACARYRIMPMPHHWRFRCRRTVSRLMAAPDGDWTRIVIISGIQGELGRQRAGTTEEW